MIDHRHSNLWKHNLWKQFSLSFWSPVFVTHSTHSRLTLGINWLRQATSWRAIRKFTHGEEGKLHHSIQYSTNHRFPLQEYLFTITIYHKSTLFYSPTEPTHKKKNTMPLLFLAERVTNLHKSKMCFFCKQTSVEFPPTKTIGCSCPVNGCFWFP